ncbi:MAG TPA: cupin domain-containing protein [Chryseolinea sp.]|nr:cupin domain-containing protein [Chryseolinea sp.]
MQPAEYWIEHLGLKPHPEGGYYRETYRASGQIPQSALPVQFPGPRNYSTAIYFLLRANERSMLHRIKSDELWHFHAGDPLTIYVLTESGVISHNLGLNLHDGDQPQVYVPAKRWFGAMINNGSYALASCTVAPGFDFADFEMGSRDQLLSDFPGNENLITMLTPGQSK